MLFTVSRIARPTAAPVRYRHKEHRTPNEHYFLTSHCPLVVFFNSKAVQARNMATLKESKYRDKHIANTIYEMTSMINRFCY